MPEFWIHWRSCHLRFLALDVLSRICYSFLLQLCKKGCLMTKRFLALWLLAPCLLLPLTATAQYESWSHNIGIGFATNVTARPLTNFPVLIILGDHIDQFSYGHFADAQGGDLRFSSLDGATEYKYEFDHWDVAADSYIWVQIPLLTNGHSIRAYWGNPAATSPPSYTTDGTMWTDAFFIAVWHLEETGPVHYDSGPGGHDGTPTNGVLQGRPGMVGLCPEFDTSNWIEVPDHSDLEGRDDLTVEAWFYLTAASSDPRGMVSKRNSDANMSYSAFIHNAAGDPVGRGCMTNDVTDWTRADNPVLANGSWHHFAYKTYQTFGIHWQDRYGDGEPGPLVDPQAPTGVPDKNTPLYIGTLYPGSPAGNWDGYIDEVRLSGVGRPDQWMKATYRTVAENSSFCSYGSAASPVPAMDTDPPGTVTISSAYMNGTLTSTGIWPTEVYLFWGTQDVGQTTEGWDGSAYFGTNSASPDVVYSTNVTGLLTDRTYYYRYFATNAAGGAWGVAGEKFITGEVSLQATDPWADEDGLDPATFTFIRPASAAGDSLDVNYTVGGSAGNGDDYTPYLTGTVTLPAGTSDFQVVLTPIVDGIWNEYVETIVLSLDSGPYPIGPDNVATAELDNAESEQTGRDWNGRMRIMFRWYDKTEPLSNFPALVVLNEDIDGFAYSQFSSDKGYDLMFLGSDYSWLDHEIEAWDTNGSSYVWVNVPVLEDSNSYVWAYWGSETATNPMPSLTNGMTFRESFRGVWHMGTTNDDSHLRDATGMGRDLTEKGGSPLEIDGVIGRAQCTTGSQGFTVHAGIGSPSGVQRLQVSCWLKHDGKGDRVFSWNDNWPSSMQISIDGETRMMMVFRLVDGQWNWWAPTIPPLADGEWHHLGMTVTGPNDYRLFVDGVRVAKDPVPYSFQTFANVTAMTSLHGGFAAGDEFRVAHAVHGDNWIWAEWANIASPSAFTAIEPIVSNGRGPSHVTSTSAYLNGYIHWTDTIPSTVSIYWGTQDGGTNRSAWQYTNDLGVPGIGAFSNFVELLPDTVYYYRCYATNEYYDFLSDPVVAFITGDTVIHVTDPYGSETGSNTIEFSISRSAACTDVATVVNYALSGDATHGVDYLTMSGNATIDPGETNVLVMITPIDDDLWYEGSGGRESVVMSLAEGFYPIGAPDNAMGWIRDNEVSHLWTRQMSIQFRGYDGAGTLFDFPALVVLGEHLDGFHYSDFGSTNGYDLRFTDQEDETLLSYEIERWNPTGLSYVWVLVPRLSSATRFVHVYWGNTNEYAASHPPPNSLDGSTWPSQYERVYHLAETSGVPLDSTTNRVDGSNEELLYRGDSLIAGGREVDAEGDAIQIPGSGPNPAGIALWYYYDALGNGPNNTLLANNSAFRHLVIDDATRRPGICDDSVFSYSTNTVLATNQWHYFHVIMDGPDYDLFVNGQLVSSFSTNGCFEPDAAALNYISTYNNGNEGAWGLLDEIRVENVARNGEWARACFLNQGSNSYFNLYYTVQRTPGGTMLLVK
jgi:hypothetical protein